MIGSGCLQPLEVQTPRASVNLDATWLWWPVGNDLKYVPGVDSTVHQIMIEPTVTMHLDPDLNRDFLDVGFGVGVLFVRGPAFENFSRAFIEPIRWEIRPFAFTGRRGSGIGVRAALTLVPRGFDAADFGAIPGSFHVSSDLVPTFGVSFDVLKLLNK